MPASTFEAFKAEIAALKDRITAHRKQTLRDEILLDRFRSLIRSWSSIVKPSVEPYLKSERDFFKLEAELEALSKLTTKYRAISEYRKRINKVIELSNRLVFFFLLPQKK